MFDFRVPPSAAMIGFMKHRLIVAYGVLLALVANPLAALAADDTEPTVYDARLEGYPGSVTLESGSTAMTWVFFIVLAALALGGLFKDAKRTHLD